MKNIVKAGSMAILVSAGIGFSVVIYRKFRERAGRSW